MRAEPTSCKLRDRSFGIYPQIQINVDVSAKPYDFKRTIFGISSICLIARQLFLILHGHKRAK